MPGVFISYRREDAAGHAGRLYERLSASFDEDQLFMDLRIPPGDDFVTRIEEGVGSCQLLLAIIGQDWLTAQDADGNRRLEDPQDYTRVEIEAALHRGVRVIPVLVGAAKMPTARDLPASLAPLSRRQAHEISDSRWDFDSNRLVELIDRFTDETIPGPRRRKEKERHVIHVDPEPPTTAPRVSVRTKPKPIPLTAEHERPGPAPLPPVTVKRPRPTDVASAPAPEAAAPAPVDRSKPFRTWGWILATIGAVLVPFLAVLAIGFGITVIARSDGSRTGTGVAIIVVSIFAASLGLAIWV